MSINLLGLLFDAEYYYTTSCLNQECDVSTALQHYIDNAALKCVAPNEYLAINPESLYKSDNSDNCIISDWLNLPISENLDKNQELLELYSEYLSDNDIARGQLIKFLQKGIYDSVDEIEELFGKAYIDRYLLNAFYKGELYNVKEKTISYLEQLLTYPISDDPTNKKILTILLNYTEKFADNDSHAKFLAKVVNNNAEFSDKFLEVIKAKGSITHEEAEKRNNYLVEALFESLTRYLGDSLILHLSKTTLLEKSTKSIITKGYDLPLYLMVEIVDYYKDRVTEFNYLVTTPQVLDNKAKIETHLKLLEQYNDNSEQIIEIIDNILHHGKHLPTKLLEQIINSSLENVKISENKEVAKYAIGIFEHLFTHLIQLPEDILNHFSKMLISEDIHLKRLALRFYKHLSILYKVNDIDTLLQVEGDINNKLEVLDIIANIKKPAFSAEQQEKILKLQEAKEQYKDSRGYRVLNEIFDEIKSKDPAAWQNKIIEEGEEKNEREFELKRNENRLQGHLNRVLKEADWPMELVLAIAKKQNKDSIHILEHVLAKISNYKLSLRLINREGENIAEIIENQNASSWIESINQLYRENNITIEKIAQELLKSIQIDDQSCLDSNAADCELLAGLTNEQIEHLNIHLQNISIFEQQHSFKLYYENIPENNTQEMMLFREDTQLYLSTPGIGKIEITTPQGNNTGISLSLYQKLWYELERKLQEGEFRLTNAEERELMNFAIGHGYSGPKKLSTWNDEEFTIWKNEHINQVTHKNLGEILAVLKEGVYRTSEDHYYPRTAQILSILMMYKSSNGRIVQVNTGEGKSTILSMFACIKVLEGKRVDIITSTSNLAERDCNDQKSFYKLLGISVGHNIRREQNLDPLKECYNGDVVYGDMLNYVGDTLSDFSFNVKNGRGFDVVIIDEVDHMFVDNSNMKVQKSAPIPGFESFGQILIYMWGIQNIIIKSLGYEAYKSFIENKNGTELVLDEKTYHELVKFIKNVPDEMVEHVKELTAGVTYNEILKQVTLPRHVEKFIAEHLPRWVNASIDTRNHIENTTYVVRNIHYYNSTDNYHIIAPVDQSTGIVQYNMNWSDGVTQFLQILHAIKLTPESLTSVFQSYASYLLKYKGHIYGATGTAGSSSHHVFASHVYGVDVAVMPSFMPKKLTMFPEMISYSDSLGWLSNIAYAVKYNAVIEKRPVLIVARNIDEMQLIASMLSEKGHTRVWKYGDYTDEKNIKKKLEAGDIIVATNLGGRGTDLKLTKEALEHGGLHVILSYLPASIRVKDQADGRAARKGEPGSAQNIINIDVRDDLSILRSKLDSQELIANDIAMHCKVPEMLMEDELFDKYLDLIRKLTSPTGMEIIVGFMQPKKLNLREDQVGIYLKDNHVYLKYIKNSRQVEPLDITDELKSIDERAYQHIVSVLKSAKSPTKLSKNDQDLLNAIVAMNDLAKTGTTTTERVKDQYAKSIKTALSPSWQAKNIWKKAPGYHNQDNTGSNSNSTNSNQSELEFKLSAKNLGSCDVKELGLLEMILRQSNDYNPDNLSLEQLTNAKLRYIYSLWLNDIAVYTKEYEILQIQENWAKLLRHLQEVIASRSQCASLAQRRFNEHDIYPINELMHQLEQDLSETNSMLKAEFNQFAKEVTKSYNSGIDLFTNPAYVIRKAYNQQVVYDYQGDNSNKLAIYEHKPLKTGVALLDKAINMDPKKAWAAHNGKAFMQLLDEGRYITDVEDAKEGQKVKEQFADSENAAVNLLLTQEIPENEMLLNFMLTSNVAPIHSELGKQQLVKLHILDKLAELYNNNTKLVKESQSNQMPRVARVLALDELFDKSKNITEIAGNHYNLTALNDQSLFLLNQAADSFDLADYRDVLDAFNQQGVIAYEMELFDLKEDSDWSGTILSVVMGIGQICLGVVLVAGGGAFLVPFSYGLIGSGIGDLIGAGLSIIHGRPININDYLKSFAMNLAINLIASSIAYIGNAHFGVAAMKGVEEGAMSTHLLKQFGLQVSMMVASQALQDMGNHALDSNDGAIESDVRDGVETLMDQHRDDMRIIFSGGPAAVRELMHAAQDILSSIAKKNHGTGAEIITSTGRTMISTFSAASTITTMGIATATSIALGYDKADGAVDEFTIRFGEAIHQIASQTNTLETISNEELDERLESFTENLISFVFTQIKGVWKSDVVGPLASFGGSLLGMGFMEFLDKTAQKLFGPKVKELEHKAQKIIIEQVKDTSEFVAVGGGSGSGSGGANDNNKPKEHTVQQGETLSEIAKKHGTTVEELKKLNPKITDPNKIFIGQKINLPGSILYATQTPVKNGQMTPIPSGYFESGPSMCMTAPDGVLDSIEAAKQLIENKAGLSVSEKMTANNELDQLKTDLANVDTTSGKTMLKVAAEGMEKIMDKYPWAGDALTIISTGIHIGVKTFIGGPVGLMAGIAGEAQGMVIGAVTGEAVGSVIILSAKQIKAHDPSLTDKQAVMLAGSALAAASMVWDAKSIVSGMKSVLGKIDLDGGFAYAGAAGDTGKFRVEVEMPRKGPEISEFSAKNAPGKFANNKFDPNKVKYEDAGYHHQNSQGLKGPSPKDPVPALKNSVPISENSPRRIGVDIENKEFVVFDKTRDLPDGTPEYHGHVRPWDELHQDHKYALFKAKITDLKGTINPKYKAQYE